MYKRREKKEKAKYKNIEIEEIFGYSYQSFCTSQLNEWAGSWMDGNI